MIVDLRVRDSIRARLLFVVICMPKVIDDYETMVRESIYRYFKMNLTMPSVSEVAGMVGSKSKGNVAVHIDSLCRQGVIKKLANGRLAPDAVMVADVGVVFMVST